MEEYSYTMSPTAEEIASELGLQSSEVTVLEERSEMIVRLPRALTPPEKAQLDNLMRLRRSRP